MGETFISKELLREKAEMFHVKLDREALDRFDIYGKMLVAWNNKINLTAITDPEDIVIKHFVDSLTIFHNKEMALGSKIIDVGTGAGFPGIPMLIARPDLQITLLDSTMKKLNVIRDILNEIGLSAEIMHSRAEEAGQKVEFREKFDYATARAVSNLRDLCEYCLPFVKVGGEFIAMKSAKAEEEISEAKAAIKVLGGKITDKKLFELPGGNERAIIYVKKISTTPSKYPRPSAKIAKNPIK